MRTRGILPLFWEGGEGVRIVAREMDCMLLRALPTTIDGNPWLRKKKHILEAPLWKEASSEQMQRR